MIKKCEEVVNNFINVNRINSNDLKACNAVDDIYNSLTHSSRLPWWVIALIIIGAISLAIRYWILDSKK